MEIALPIKCADNISDGVDVVRSHVILLRSSCMEYMAPSASINNILSTCLEAC